MPNYVDNKNFKTHEDELEFLESLGFPINPYNFKAKNLEEVWKQGEKIEKIKDKAPYPIDGLVVKVNDNNISEKAGAVGKTLRTFCAIKFKAEEATTKIIEVKWQVGRTGKLTPVAELEPVNLAGTVVKRATLHNYKEVQDMDLKIGDMVVVWKAGDIIPEVVKVLVNLRKENAENINVIEHCPSCGTRLKMTSTGVDLMCPNYATCHDQVVNRLSYYTSRNIANIEGLSAKNIEKFTKELAITDIPDLYNLPYEKIFELEGFGRKSVENLQKSVENSKRIDDYKFLAGLGIEGVGIEVAKLICQKIKDKEQSEANE